VSALGAALITGSVLIVFAPAGLLLIPPVLIVATTWPTLLATFCSFALALARLAVALVAALATRGARGARGALGFGAGGSEVS